MALKIYTNPNQAAIVSNLGRMPVRPVPGNGKQNGVPIVRGAPAIVNNQTRVGNRNPQAR